MSTTAKTTNARAARLTVVLAVLSLGTVATPDAVAAGGGCGDVNCHEKANGLWHVDSEGNFLGSCPNTVKA